MMCDCQTVKRYGNTWQCMLCGRKFITLFEKQLRDDYKVKRKTAEP